MENTSTSASAPELSALCSSSRNRKAGAHSVEEIRTGACTICRGRPFFFFLGGLRRAEMWKLIRSALGCMTWMDVSSDNQHVTNIARKPLSIVDGSKMVASFVFQIRILETEKALLKLSPLVKLFFCTGEPFFGNTQTEYCGHNIVFARGVKCGCVSLCVDSGQSA